MRRVEETHWWFRGRRERALALADRFGLGGRILDLGCGTGANARSFASRGEVVALDVSIVAARFTRDRGCPRVAVGDALRLPFRPAEFDAVLAFDLMEHLADDRGAMREVERVLRPRGMLLMTVPACPPLFGSHDRALHHFRRYGRSGCLALGRRSGLGEARSVGYYAGAIFPVLLSWRWLQKTLLRGSGRSDVGRSIPPWLNRVLLALVRMDDPLPLPLGGTLIALFAKGR